MGIVGEVAGLAAKAKGHFEPNGARQLRCIFYGWVIVGVCIFCKIFKVQAGEPCSMYPPPSLRRVAQGQNNVMSYTVSTSAFFYAHARFGSSGMHREPG